MRFRPGDVVRYEPSIGAMDRALNSMPNRPLPLSAGVVVLVVVLPLDAYDNQDDALKFGCFVVFPPDTKQWLISDDDLTLICEGEPCWVSGREL